MLDKTLNTALEIDWSASLGHRCIVRVEAWNQGLGATAIDDDEVASLSLQQVGDWLLVIPILRLPTGGQLFPMRWQGL